MNVLVIDYSRYPFGHFFSLFFFFFYLFFFLVRGGKVEGGGGGEVRSGWKKLFFYRFNYNAVASCAYFVPVGVF